MIYSELQATVSATGGCDTSASGDPVGPSYAVKTIGYSSRFLAYGTVTFPGPNCDEQYIEDGFHTIDFSELYYTPIVTSTVYKAGCAPYANPRLSLPADLTDVVPAWKTCQPLFYGAFDPPSFLSKASRLAPAPAGPAVVTSTSPPVPALPAATQATPAAATPVATIAPNSDGKKAVAIDPPASVIDSNQNGNTHETVATTATSPEVSDPNSQKTAAADHDPSGQATGPSAAILVNSPVQTPASAANVVIAQGKTLTENGPSAIIGGKAAVYSKGSIYVDSTPVAVPTSVQVAPARVVVAQGQTLTEGGPLASVGGKAAVYSAGSIYLDSSAPIAVPNAEATNVVIAQGQTLTENGSTASIGGKAAVYSAGSLYYDSTPIAIPKASPTNMVVAQGQTLKENGPSAIIGGKTAIYKAGSIYYDSTPVAVPTQAPGRQTPPPAVAAGVTFAPSVQTPSLVVANGITFAPAVEKASPIVAAGITFAPISQTIGGDTREPIVAGGINFQPSHIQSPNAVALETPAPLSVGSDPVLRVANGGLMVAGITISQGSTTSLLGHIIAANSDNVVVDGLTHSLAPVTAYPVETPTPTPLEIANRPVLIADNGDLVIAGNTVSQGSTTNLLGHAISVGLDNVVLDGTTHAFGPLTAHPLETPAPLEIANHPVIKAADGGLVIAGTTIPQGSQTSLFGHVISVGASNVVDDGKTLAFAANTEVAGQQSVTSLLFGTSNVETTLTPGAPYSSGGHITTYTGSTPSVLTEATSSVTGTTTVPLQASSLPGQVFVEVSASATPEQLFVQTSPSAEKYVLNGKTATAAAASDVPIGGIVLAGLASNGSASLNSSALPSIVLENATVTSILTSQLGSSSGSTSEPGSKASPSKPVHGKGPRVMSRLWASGNCFGVFGYILVIALISSEYLA